MEKLIARLKQDYAWITFVSGPMASWSSQDQQITYKSSKNIQATWPLFHELGHALAGHSQYESDVGLLQKETEAWEKAVSIAPKYKVEISEDHIQACLDTYRDWLHKRSTCPNCAGHGLQQSKALYRCVNCQSTWTVSSARFCRPYRLKKALSV